MAYGSWNDSGYNPYGGGGWNTWDQSPSGMGGYGYGYGYSPDYMPDQGFVSGRDAPTGATTAGTGQPNDSNGTQIATDYGHWTRPLGGGPFQAPTQPGSYGSFDVGPGGRGMVSAVGEFQPGAAVQSPVGAVSDPGFQAPTMAEVEGTPGYEFRRREGERAIENAAAAQGIARTGGAMKDLMRYGQDYATGEYDRAYTRALGENQLSYHRALQENQDQYGRALGEYQMGYGQRGDVYDASMQRAMAEARMGETGAGRQLAADRLRYDANQRRYDDLYRRQLGEYMMGRDEDRWQDTREWNRAVAFPMSYGQQAQDTLG